MSERNATMSVARPALLLAGLLLIATNLRAPMTGVAPVLTRLQAAFALSPAQAGLLTTLPLLALGFISPFAALFARKYGLERALFAALLSIAGGVLLRSLGSAGCLYLGTGIIGAGIAVGNVLLPSLVKRDFPLRVPTITGMCALTMGAAGALASTSAVPLANAFGWQTALGLGIAFPLLAMALWSIQLGAHTGPARGTAAVPQDGNVWHSALAWQVTLFMGLNSFLYYVLIGWLPAILTATGFSPAAAGSLHGMMQLASAVPGLFLGSIVNRMRDQKLVAAGMGILMGIALCGLRFAPGGAALWTCLFGAGSGGAVLLALVFMGLRTGSPQQAAALSGMAQGVGYLLAACGPTLAGKLHDLAGGWNVPLVIGIALAVVMTVFGALAGRARTIGMDRPGRR